MSELYRKYIVRPFDSLRRPTGLSNGAATLTAPPVNLPLANQGAPPGSGGMAPLNTHGLVPSNPPGASHIPAGATHPPSNPSGVIPSNSQGTSQAPSGIANPPSDSSGSVPQNSQGATTASTAAPPSAPPPAPIPAPTPAIGLNPEGLCFTRRQWNRLRNIRRWPIWHWGQGHDDAQVEDGAAPTQEGVAQSVSPSGSDLLKVPEVMDAEIDDELADTNQPAPSGNAQANDQPAPDGTDPAPTRRRNRMRQWWREHRPSATQMFTSRHAVGRNASAPPAVPAQGTSTDRATNIRNMKKALKRIPGFGQKPPVPPALVDPPAPRAPPRASAEETNSISSVREGTVEEFPHGHPELGQTPQALLTAEASPQPVMDTQSTPLPDTPAPPATATPANPVQSTIPPDTSTPTESALPSSRAQSQQSSGAKRSE